VASGVRKHPTPVGHFEIMEKVENKRSNLYGKIYTKSGKVLRSDAKTGRDTVPTGARFEGARMPYFLRLTYDGIGLHAGPIPRPGRPASHGCIRMPSKMAPVLFKHVNLGTKVSIVGKGPDYGNYVQKQRVLAAERAARAREQQEIEARQAAAAPAPAVTPSRGSAPDSAQGSAPSGSISTVSTGADTATRPDKEAPTRQAGATDTAAAARREAVPVNPSGSPAAAKTTPAPDSGPIQAMGTPAAPVPAAPTAPVTTPVPPAASPTAVPAAPSVAYPPMAPTYPPMAPAYPMPQRPAYVPMMRPAFVPVPGPPAPPGAAASSPPPKEAAGTSASAPSEG
jgi:hypothetical protein